MQVLFFHEQNIDRDTRFSLSSDCNPRQSSPAWDCCLPNARAISHKHLFSVEEWLRSISTEQMRGDFLQNVAKTIYFMQVWCVRAFWHQNYFNSAFHTSSSNVFAFWGNVLRLCVERKCLDVQRSWSGDSAPVNLEVKSGSRGFVVRFRRDSYCMTCSHYRQAKREAYSTCRAATLLIACWTVMQV